MPALGHVVLDAELDGPSGVRVAEFLGGATITARRATAGPDGEAATAIQLTRNDERRPVFRVAFDGNTSARARLRPGGASSSLTLCAMPLRPLFTPDGNRASFTADFESEAYFGPGWQDAERSPAGHVRRGRGGCTLLLPLDEGYDYEMIVNAAGTEMMRVALNGHAIDGCPATAGQPCRLKLPAATIRSGINSMTLLPVGDITFRDAELTRTRPTRPASGGK
jgi:hypothetical protein